MKTTAFNSVLEKSLAKAEEKSWQGETVVKFRIYIKRRFKRKNFTDTQWFDREVAEQSNAYPRGITEQQAFEIAGKDGTVHRLTITTQRIK